MGVRDVGIGACSFCPKGSHASIVYDLALPKWVHPQVTGPNFITLNPRPVLQGQFMIGIVYTQR